MSTIFIVLTDTAGDDLSFVCAYSTKEGADKRAAELNKMLHYKSQAEIEEYGYQVKEVQLLV